METEAHPEGQKPAEDDPILCYKEAASFLGKAYQTLANLRSSGTGPVQDGDGYRRSELVRWNAEQVERRRLREEARRDARKNKDQLSLFDYLRRNPNRSRDVSTG